MEVCYPHTTVCDIAESSVGGIVALSEKGNSLVDLERGIGFQFKREILRRVRCGGVVSEQDTQWIKKAVTLERLLPG